MFLGHRDPPDQGSKYGRSSELSRVCPGFLMPLPPATTYNLGLCLPRPRDTTSRFLSQRRKRPLLQPLRLTCRVIRDLIFCMSEPRGYTLPQRINKSLSTTIQLAPTQGSHSEWSRGAANFLSSSMLGTAVFRPPPVPAMEVRGRPRYYISRHAKQLTPRLNQQILFL